MSFDNRKDAEKVLELVDVIKALRDLTETVTPISNEYIDKINNIVNDRINVLLEDLENVESNIVGISTPDMLKDIPKNNNHKRYTINHFMNEIDREYIPKGMGSNNAFKSFMSKPVTLNNIESYTSNTTLIKNTHNGEIITYDFLDNSYIYFSEHYDANNIEDSTPKKFYIDKDIEIYVNNSKSIINIKILNVPYLYNKSIQDSLKVIVTYLRENNFDNTSPTFKYLLFNVVSYIKRKNNEKKYSCINNQYT
jgi:hypothetical protein